MDSDTERQRQAIAQWLRQNLVEVNELMSEASQPWLPFVAAPRKQRKRTPNRNPSNSASQSLLQNNRQQNQTAVNQESFQQKFLSRPLHLESQAANLCDRLRHMSRRQWEDNCLFVKNNPKKTHVCKCDDPNSVVYFNDHINPNASNLTGQF